MSFSSPYFTLPRFMYIRPKSVSEALSLLEKHGEDARVMAGGVGVINMLKERLMDPKIIIDLKGIPELHHMSNGNGELKIGATTTLNELLRNDVVKNSYPALWEAISLLSDHNLRNRSTLVGDICEGMPWVDSPPPLIAYGAKLEIVGPRGRRITPVEGFIKGMAQVALASNEIVTAVTVPAPPSDSRGRYYKFSKGSEFGLVNLAMVASGYESGYPKEVRLVYGGISDTPIVADGVTEIFRNLPSSRRDSPSEIINSALKWVTGSVQPMDDNLASAEYRKNLVEVMTAQALREALGRR